VRPCCVLAMDWVAHGSGDADLETVDGHDAASSSRTEIHLTQSLADEEEKRYYYGSPTRGSGRFALSHPATFRVSDWGIIARQRELPRPYWKRGWRRTAGSGPGLPLWVVATSVKKRDPDAWPSLHIPGKPRTFGIALAARLLEVCGRRSDRVPYQSHVKLLATVDRSGITH